MRKSQWAYLAATQRCLLAGARGEEGRAGGAARWALAKEAPRPGRLTAVRSPAWERVRRRGGQRRRLGSLLVLIVVCSVALCSTARCCCAEERQVHGEERERGKNRMAPGFQGSRCGRRFVHTTCADGHRIIADGAD